MTIETLIESGDIGPYQPCIFDGWCGEPIGWGHPILKRLGDEKWKEASQLGKMDCIYPNWFLVTKWLTRKEAIEKYGEETGIERGPRGGFQNITFGEKKFCMRELCV